jgi:hypothetical protein
MENLVKVHLFTRRRIALIAVGIVAGATLLTPTVGQAATFLTKQKAHKLYLGNTAIVSNTVTLASGTGQAVTVLCPGGRQAVDGGFITDAALPSLAGTVPLESYPVISGGRSVGWTVEAINNDTGGTSHPITVQAVCSK